MGKICRNPGGSGDPPCPFLGSHMCTTTMPLVTEPLRHGRQADHTETETSRGRYQSIPCSTSECERGFSAVNLIMTDLHSTLTIKHVAALLFIQLHGPPLSKWKPQVYVSSWLVQHRSTTDTRTRVAAAAVEEDMQNPDPLWDVL